MIAHTTLPKVEGIISDLDGVVYRGSEPIPSAVAAFRDWHERGIPYCFVTNNSTRTPEAVADLLNGMGVICTPRQVVTSATATASLLTRRWPKGGRAFVLGAPSLEHAVVDAGFVMANETVDCVVIGLDRALTFERMSKAVQLVLDGAVLIGTNPDLLLPTASGFEPGAGALLTAVAVSTGRQPIIIGKPEPQLIEDAVMLLGIPAARAIMIGDQLATDIVAGQRAGVFSILVETGVPSQESREIIADLIATDLACLQALIT